MQQIFILRLALLSLFSVKTFQTWNLEMNPQAPCPLTDNWREINKRTIEPRFHVGCTVVLECRYRPECTIPECNCKFNNNTNLTIIPPSDTILNSMVELNRSNCHVEVEIRNLTTDFKGDYFCKDTTLPGVKSRREMFVGYPPESPSDVDLHFQPMNHLQILFNVGRTGEELNDKNTKWKVCYNWSVETSIVFVYLQTPQHEEKVTMTIDALTDCFEDDPIKRHHSRIQWTHRVCAVTFFIKSDTSLSSHDIFFKPIFVSITANNLFGMSGPVINRLSILDYIRPHLTRHNALTVVSRGTTWLQLRVLLPKGIEPKVCKEMALRSNGRNQLKLKYGLYNLSQWVQSQSLPDNIKFKNKHGFWRNLQSDEEASSRVSMDVVLPFNMEFNWTDFNCSHALVNVSGLAPNICVNITMQAGGRYWGPEVIMNYSYTCTEDEILEGPKFGATPYFCYNESPCVTCAIYFMEIPILFRGGRVNNYTLNGTRTSSAQTSNTECHNKWDFFVNASGQDNTIIVQNLEPEVTYNLSLQAFTTSGASPSSNYILPTSTSTVPSAPVKVDVEGGVNGGLYTVTWQAGNGESAEYFVHYCFALTKTLNCTTNMVTEKAGNSSMQKKSVEVPIIAKSIEGDTLIPIFFVSVATGDGQTSGLLKAECAYAVDKDPGKIPVLKVQPSDVENEFVVDFDTPCGQNYEYGRPEEYLIQVFESMNCPPCNTGQNAEYLFKEIVDADKEGRHIQRLFKVNKINTSYCLGVKTTRDFSELDQWEWTSFSTSDSMVGQDVRRQFILGISLSLGILFLCCLSGWMCYSKCKSAAAKFGKNEKFKKNTQKVAVNFSFIFSKSNDPLLHSDTSSLYAVIPDPLQTSEDSIFQSNDNLKDNNNSDRDKSLATSSARSQTCRISLKGTIDLTSKADKPGPPHYCRVVHHVSDVTPTTELSLSVSRNASSSHASQKCKTVSCLQTLHTFTSTLSPENDLLLQEPEFSGFRLTPSRPFSAGTDTKKRLPAFAVGQRSSCLQTCSQTDATCDVFRLLTPTRPLTSQPEAVVSRTVHWPMPNEVDAKATSTDRNPASCHFMLSVPEVDPVVENIPAQQSKNGQDAGRSISVDMTSSDLFWSLFPPTSSEFSDTAFTALTPSRPFSQQSGGGGGSSFISTDTPILRPTRSDVIPKDTADSSLNAASREVSRLNFASSNGHCRPGVPVIFREGELCVEKIINKQISLGCLTPAMTAFYTMKDKMPRNRYSLMPIKKDKFSLVSSKINRYSLMSSKSDRYSLVSGTTGMSTKDRYSLNSKNSDSYEHVRNASGLCLTNINLLEEAVCHNTFKTDSSPESTELIANDFDHNLNIQRYDSTNIDDKLYCMRQLEGITVQMRQKDSDKTICLPNVFQQDDEATRHSFDSLGIDDDAPTNVLSRFSTRYSVI